MKKFPLTLVLLIASIIYTNELKAQINPKFGLRGGINFASFSDSKQEVDSRRIGLLTGVYAVIPIYKTSFSIQPEVFYTQKGAEINNVEINLSYLEIPVLARVDFDTEANLNPHIYAGSYAAFTLNHKEEPEGSASIKTNDILYGLIFGVGIDINKINVGIRYSLGLKEVYENEEARNNVISIVAGFQF